MITYSKGNLFHAPRGVYLAHACNCRGKWGAGVAHEFRNRFPNSYKEYQRYCRLGAKPGDIFICSEESGYQVICLFTSESYGSSVDAADSILEATKQASSKFPIDKPIHMPKINSGLFKVPWELTEEILRNLHQDITVWEL